MSTLLKEFCDIINQNTEPGDVLEFGTGSGGSSSHIASNIDKQRKVFTFDGFQGLPETNKKIPVGTGWEKGAYFYDENKIRDLLKLIPNIIVNKAWSWELKFPNEYGIDKIVAVNVDFDLYEGTLDALRFSDKCTWNTLLLRFDDWGCYPHQIAAEVDAHEKAAFFDWIKETNHQYEINQYLVNVSYGMQSIITVKS